MYHHVNAQGVDERMINVHYYYYYYFGNGTKMRLRHKKLARPRDENSLAAPVGSRLTRTCDLSSADHEGPETRNLKQD